LRLLQSRIDEAQHYLDLAGALIDVAGEDEAILLRWLTALLQAARGLLPTAIASARAALALAVDAGISDLEADCRRVLGSLLGRSGALEEAEAELETALRLSVEQRNLYRQGLTAYELGWLSRRTYEVQGDPAYRASATARLRHAAALFEKLPARFDLERVRRALAELP
jgi:hypothetical protein